VSELAGDCELVYPRPYAMAAEQWGEKVSSQGVPYMRHIDDGIRIIDMLREENHIAKQVDDAFILHGLFQSYIDVGNAYSRKYYDKVEPQVLMLVMEYRNIANQWLSPHGFNPTEKPKIPLFETRVMLVADKIQNYSNFLKNYKLIHPHHQRLDAYFRAWHEHLGVRWENFEHLFAGEEL
jgi:hypothetical protein